MTIFMTNPGVLSTKTTWSSCPLTSGYHERSCFLPVHNVSFPQTKHKLSLPVVEPALLPFQTSHPPLQRAWPITDGSRASRMDGGWERNGGREAQEANADNNVMNCLWKGSSKAASQPCAGNAGSALLSSPSGSCWWTGNPPALLSLLPLFFWQKGGNEWKRLLTRQQQTDKSL